MSSLGGEYWRLFKGACPTSMPGIGELEDTRRSEKLHR